MQKLILSSCVLALASTTLSAAPADITDNQAQGRPFTIDSLPPGLFRSQLEALPDQARSRAAQWLSTFTFPGNDVDFLRADENGGIYYADTELPEPVTAAEAEASTSSITAVDNALALHSKPGAAHILFLDFDGGVVSQNTAWTSTDLYAQPFDPNNNPGFDADELNRIAEIWHRVADDFAAFDIDVTTEDPGSRGPHIGHVMITANSDAYGMPMPSSGAGGVAYVGVYGTSYYTSYQPAFVYWNNLGNGHAPYVAEASSHEFGHNLSLSHDGTSTAGYYTGHGSGLSSWAPIMGVGYYTNVTQWSKGDYADANNSQDDLQIIADRLNYRSDDHGGDLFSASALSVAADGSISATNPQQDATNANPVNKGVITTAAGDTDYFWFEAGNGAASLTVTPAWDAFTRTSRRGANLDVGLQLFDASGNLISSSAPLDDTQASLNVNLSAGIYYLAVSATGNAEIPYNDYASQGFYYIRGQVQPAEAGTNQPPMADFSASCLGLTCTFSDLSSDSDGSLTSHQWDFGDGNLSSQINPVHSYAAAGSYSVQLVVTDDQGLSSSRIQTVNVTAPELPVPATPQGLGALDNADGSATLSWNSVTDASEYLLERQAQHPKNGKWTGSTLLNAGSNTQLLDAAVTGNYRFRVQAVNASGSSAWSSFITVSVTGANSGGSDGGGSGGACKGKKKNC